MLKSFEQLKALLAARPVKRRIGVVAAHDTHTLEAVMMAAGDGLIHPLLLGDKNKILSLLDQLSFETRAVEIMDIPEAEMAAQKAADMVRAGEIDAIMKGKLETGTLMKILVNKERGIRRGDTMSLLALIQSPYYHKVFAVTDVGLLTYPSLEQKKSAIDNGMGAFHALGVARPKVAVLAAVEKVNPKMKESVEADLLKRMAEDGQINGCVVEGPISYDLAMDKDAAGIKGYQSPVAGDADILVVPDIVSGNVLAKSLTCTGGAKTCGVVLGALVPLVITSRSAAVDDKYMSIVLSALAGGDNNL